MLTALSAALLDRVPVVLVFSESGWLFLRLYFMNPIIQKKLEDLANQLEEAKKQNREREGLVQKMEGQYKNAEFQLNFRLERMMNEKEEHVFKIQDLEQRLKSAYADNELLHTEKRLVLDENAYLQDSCKKVSKELLQSRKVESQRRSEAFSRWGGMPAPPVPKRQNSVERLDENANEGRATGSGVPKDSNLEPQGQAKAKWVPGSTAKGGYFGECLGRKMDSSSPSKEGSPPKNKSENSGSNFHFYPQGRDGKGKWQDAYDDYKERSAAIIENFVTRLDEIRERQPPLTAPVAATGAGPAAGDHPSSGSTKKSESNNPFAPKVVDCSTNAAGGLSSGYRPESHARKDESPGHAWRVKRVPAQSAAAKRQASAGGSNAKAIVSRHAHLAKSSSGAGSVTKDLRHNLSTHHRSPTKASLGRTNNGVMSNLRANSKSSSRSPLKSKSWVNPAPWSFDVASTKLGEGPSRNRPSAKDLQPPSKAQRTANSRSISPLKKNIPKWP